jgi:hypothetical protein
MSDPTTREAMLELRTEHVTEMQTWRDTYGSDPTTPQARQALADLRQEHRADMRALMEQFGIKVPGRMRGGMMDGGSGGGMMDGSGGMIGGSSF